MSATIRSTSPRTERRSWRRKIQRTHRDDPKRRRKKRIVKREKESVFLKKPLISVVQLSCNTYINLYQFCIYVSIYCQDHAVNDREASLETKRRKDENGTSKFVFNLCCEAVLSHCTLCIASFKNNFVCSDSSKTSKSTSPSCDSPLSTEKEKSKRPKSSSKEKGESVKTERISAAGKKVSSSTLYVDLSISLPGQITEYMSEHIVLLFKFAFSISSSELFSVDQCNIA